MVFSSTVFLFVFLPCVIIAYYNPLLKTRKYKNYVLLVCSVIFYAYGEPIFVFLLIIVTFINWFLAKRIMIKGSKKYLWFAISLDACILFVMKYLAVILNALLSLVGKDMSISVHLPIGISFFTFQIISYVVDVYRNPRLYCESPLEVAIFSMMFPQLIAGPIVRYKDISESIFNRNESIDMITSGITRFVVGLGKKVILADYLAILVQRIFEQCNDYSVMSVWLGAGAYTLQIYFDFSGYSDMAIGLGKIFGFNFPENFNYPYISKSVTEFWRRWHITLSMWFRDYVYIPMGGARRGKKRQILNLFLVWLLTGIWHGVGFTFILWGMLNFVILTIEKNVSLNNDGGKISGIAKNIITMVITTVLWTIFRADSISDAVSVLKLMVGIGSNGLIDAFFLREFSTFKWLVLTSVVLSTPLLRKFLEGISKDIRNCMIGVGTALIYIISIGCCIYSTYSPFIYFNF